MRKQPKSDVLEYIKLDLNNIPSNIYSENVDIKANEINTDKNYKVYKYVKINKINIVLTNSRRLDSPAKKLETMNDLSYFLDKKNIEEYNQLTQIFKSSSIDDIEELDSFQKMFKNKIPSKIKYSKDYLWQIFYIERTDQYYMIVPLQETEFQAFLYLLMKKIKKSSESIYVPICNLDYSNCLISKAKVNKIENDLYYFTKQWPMIYEVYNYKNESSLYIIGTYEILNCISSNYKITYRTKDEIKIFYDFIETIFSIQVELSNYFTIEVYADEKGLLHFYYNNNEITNNNLETFYHNEIEHCKKSIEDTNKIKKSLTKKLAKLKSEELKLNTELANKQKQITTFLECKKTFLGRVKYFFKRSKKQENDIAKAEQSNISNDVQEETVALELEDNIEDLIYICKILKNKLAEAATIRLDIQNLEIKLNILKKKIENATLFIDEIESHKKSILEFWKFTNKDEQNQLSEGLTEIVEQSNIERNFDFQDNFLEFSKYIDSQQRNKLTFEEQNSILLADYIGLENISNTSLKKDNLDTILANTKDNYINEDELNHREKIRNPYDILKLTSESTNQEIITKFKEILKNLETAFDKCKTNINLPVFSSVEPNNRIMEFEINPKKLSLAKSNTTVYKINIKTGTNILGLSNIVFFHNRNNTLPLGMNYSTKILLDLRKKTLIKTNTKEQFVIELQDNSPDETIKKITIVEYLV